MLEIDRDDSTAKSEKRTFFDEYFGLRAIGNALDVDVLKMAPEYKNFDNPFFWHYKMN